MAAPENATARLSRLLTMVPWLVNRQGVDIEEAGRALGVSTDQIESDLQLLFLCGTPGHLPDDLIEAEWEEGRVYLRNADTIARPLRLSRDEALALVVGLRTLAAVPGLGQRDAIDRALAKLTEATGDTGEGSSRVRVSLDDVTARDALAIARQALSDGRRLHLRYLVAARDESTERDVDPMRLVGIDGHWYLEGWCHRAREVRLFRLDRVERAEVLDVDGTPPADARPRDLDAGVFTPTEEDIEVVLEVDAGASWVGEYYPVDDVHELGDGGRRITLRAADTVWVRSLVWRLGGHARVVTPPELAREISAGADEALAAYESSAR